MKGRASKRLWFLLATGIFVVALAGLGTAYAGQLQEQTQLKQELSVSQKTLASSAPDTFISQQADTKTQLASSSEQIIAATKQLSPAIINSDIDEQLLATAASNAVEVLSVNSDAQTNVVVGKLSYRLLPLNIEVQSNDLSSMLGFISQVSTQFRTSVTKSLDVSATKVDAVTGAQTFSASMKLEIYSYNGD